MRAVVVRKFGTLDDLELETVPKPSPGENEVLIAVQSAAVNFADLLVIAGKYQSLPELPFVAGREVAGVVEAVGPGVSRLTPGQRVMAYVDSGGFGEYALAHENVTCVVPEGVGADEAVAMGIAYQTAYFALIDRARLQSGETVLVNGASGGVGVATVQLAKALGAGTVLAGLTSPNKAEFVLKRGADAVVDLSRDDLRDGLRGQVRDLTGGGAADVVVDMIGGEVFDASLRALAWRGRIIVVGFTSGRIPQIASNYLLLKNISATGMYWGSYLLQDPAWIRRVQGELFDLFRDGRLTPAIMQTLPLERFRDALAIIGERKVAGRVLLTTGAGD